MGQMLKKVLLLLGAACLFSCQTRKPDLLPPSGPYFRSLSIKFNFRDGTVRQNGRIHWRFDDQCAKFLFFTPLNQVGLELDVAAEDALLVNFSKKAFWRGNFSQLLDRMWGIDLTLSGLKSLLVKGEVPQAEFTGKGVSVSLKNNGKTGAPEAIRLRRGAADLTLQIIKSEFHTGKIILIDYADRYQAADLESVLNDD